MRCSTCHGAARRAPDDRLRAGGAVIKRLDRECRHRSWKRACRRSGPSAPPRPACASRSRSVAGNSAARLNASETSDIGPKCHGLWRKANAEVSDRHANRPFRPFALCLARRQADDRRANRPLRPHRRCACRRSRRSGAISASGTSTKARSNSRGCGSIRSRLLNRQIVIRDDVDIDRARAPALLVRAVAAERAFHLLRAREQFVRRERRLHLDAEVHEGRLLRDAPGRRFVI